MPFVDTLAPRARVVGMIMSKIIRDGEAEAMCNVQCKKEGCSARRSMYDKIGDEFAALLLCKVSIILPLSGKRKRIVDLTPMHLASIRRSNILDKDASSHAPEKAVKRQAQLYVITHPFA